MSNDYCVGFWKLENHFAPEEYPNRLEWLEKFIRSDLKGWMEALFNVCWLKNWQDGCQGVGLMLFMPTRSVIIKASTPPFSIT